MPATTVTVSTEPERISKYFDKRGWPGESRTHAEVSEVFRPTTGWRIYTGPKKVSEEWLLGAEAQGITSITVRVRYSDRRTISADFGVKELLTK